MTATGSAAWKKAKHVFHPLARLALQQGAAVDQSARQLDSAEQF